MQESDYRARAAENGFGEPELKHYAAGHALGDHAHDPAVFLLIKEGEFTVTVNGATRVLRPGDTLELASGVPHSEAVGPDGVTFLVARK